MQDPKLISTEILELLAKTDTPTVCNAIELAQGKRGFNQFTRGKPVALHARATPAFGFARTAKIEAENPPELSTQANRQRRMDYYRYMSEGARPAICVIEDTDAEPVGAFWGEVNTNVHRGFGLTGTLTNGVIRDLDACPKDYQVIGGSIGPSHRFVHVRDIGGDVEIFGLHIREGDFVHADRHGAVIVPDDILPKIDFWIEKMQQIEEIVIKPSQQRDFNFESFEKSWIEMEKKRV